MVILHGFEEFSGCAPYSLCLHFSLRLDTMVNYCAAFGLLATIFYIIIPSYGSRVCEYISYFDWTLVPDLAPHIIFFPQCIAYQFSLCFMFANPKVDFQKCELHDSKCHARFFTYIIQHSKGKLSGILNSSIFRHLTGNSAKSGKNREFK